jgi:predicted KAP-like P-loop ATPase
VGEVKTEVEYLFDLLATETYLDKEIGCSRPLRLCVFIDDLDRCPKELVVSVLEAVILLLVDGPISVWMAIDSRIVVQCIEAVKHGVFDKANISGHEFLDKIVQLPFALPELTNDAKESYLDKIVDEKELNPARVLTRFKREGLHEELK